ncbi:MULTISPECIES: hypothetical protein [unclassified Spirosoma]|uniref:hypothetical protein n=1 Tax=unclassified Spirosoma TaxID=2621999 RepID=UPI000B073327|nr:MULTISPECIES: hypothetical protein [unclassified Spirosoma]MBN8821881.1 hypothetical protein [Spirosoma sp.]
METQQKAISPGNSELLLKIDSIRNRAQLLTGLRKMLSLPPEQDISADQWEALESQLATVSNKIRQQLRIYTDKYFSERNDPIIRQTLINRLGELEMDLASAYTFYDTFMDILTQRLSPDIGPLLKGCDAIAAHALQRGSLADITVPPLVCCDRGFGAFTVREGVSIIRNAPNPIPFIAIPYSRINEKYNLISIFHEVGHQALTKLNMVPLWQQVVYESLKKTGATPLMRSLFANWSKELLPDFWAFCLSGMAQTSSIRDVLILPASMMFSISTIQPHPPSYLRFLLSVEWCRQLWGKGDWDNWEAEWLEFYPLKSLDETTRQLILEARQYLPTISRAVLQTKFKKLGNRPLTSLFALGTLTPQGLKAMATIEGIQTDTFRNQPIGVQLAVFRLLREKRTIKQITIDALMDSWLKGLAKK